MILDKLRLIIELYRNIFEYLDTDEYLEFINTCKEFGDIKRGTIQFSLELQSNTYWELWKAIKLVKDPKKQISLKLTDPPKDDLVLVGLFSTYLYRVEVSTSTTTFTNDFDFSIFNNIPIVSLTGFRGITEIHSGLQNIHRLQLRIDRLKKIYDFNVSGALQILDLTFHFSIDFFPDQKEDTCLHDLCDLNASTRRMRFALLGHDRLDMTQLFTHHLEQLELEFVGSELHKSEMDALIHIPDLSLSYAFPPDDNPFHEGFTTFYGYKLQLEHFDFCWGDYCEFPNLRTLKLTYCRTADRLPYFPNIKRLDFENVDDLRVIPSYPSLRHMALEEVNDLIRIENQPMLMSLVIDSCLSITDLNFHQIKLFSSVRLNDCQALTNISSVLTSINLDIINCPKVRLAKLNGIQSDHYHMMMWFFVDLNCLERLKTIRNLKSIELTRIQNTNFDQLRISSIQGLKISDCIDLETTSNISDIKEELLIEKCPNLISLQNLQHTKIVMLFSLPKIRDISGLGYNHHLFIYEVPYLSELASSYSDTKKKGKEKSHPFHCIFRTIRCCTLLRVPASSSKKDSSSENSELSSSSEQLCSIYDRIFSKEDLW